MSIRPQALTEQRPDLQNSRPETRHKRTKIDIACETCRSRKVKCDGARPTCSNCARKLSLRDTCHYAETSLGKRSSSAQSVSSLGKSVAPSPNRGPSTTRSALRKAQRIASQKDAFTKGHLGHSPRTNVALHSTSPGQGFDAPISPYNDRSTGDMSQLAGSSPGRPGSESALLTNATSASAADSMTIVPDQGSSTHEYFGSTSAGSFTTQIRRCLDSRHGGSSDLETSAPAPVPYSKKGVNRHEFHYVLPPRRQADYLMEHYWKYVDPLYPFLDRSIFQSSYEAMFSGSSAGIEETILMALMNIIFALSTNLVESWTYEKREESSKTYFRRAQVLVPLNTWEGNSVSSVQYLLLVSQYLQGTESPHQTWMVVGSAIRIAQGLGLHLPERSADQPTGDKRELSRRIWHGCVLMDRMVAMTHGRPAMISSQLASVVPLPYHNSAADGEHERLLGNPADHALFFVKSVELYEIIHRTILALYHPGPNSDPAGTGRGLGSDSEDVQLALQLDAELWKLESGLPEELRWSTTEISHQRPGDKAALRVAVILHIRLLHARILVLRPFLARFCLSHPAEAAGLSDSLQARVVQQCAVLCVSTAKSIIAALFHNQASDGTVGALPAWWYRIYYLYTAATILIAANLRPQIFPATDLGESWGQAISLLQAHEHFGPTSRRCVAALHVLMCKISKDYLYVGDDGGIDAHDPEASHLATIREGPTQEAPLGTETNTNIFLPTLDEFTFSFGDLNEIAISELDFDVNNLSWLNDMQGTWELLNE